ncbi:MAG: endonuclease/exonuclease/phosphatase family protein [bacterium]|nr:endonuclease/exonuclease/phosphatase family protein [bacterium]
MSSFSILDLNIMHGRNSRSPIFPPRFSRQKIENNLKKIVDVIQGYNPEIVTLQEVDQASVLSGDFNQFDLLDKNLNYSYKYFSPSCSIIFWGKKIFVSGNAIFSKYPLENCQSYNFDFSFPTERKGFIIADAKLPQDQTLTIASVHLVWIDWMRSNSRVCQLDLVTRVLAERKNPTVIAGDMNCNFLGKETSLRSFVNQLNLKVYDPENKDLNTSPSWNPYKRIDWILASKEIDFISYKTIANRVSDHLAVFAKLSNRSGDPRA